PVKSIPRTSCPWSGQPRKSPPRKSRLGSRRPALIRVMIFASRAFQTAAMRDKSASLRPGTISGSLFFMICFKIHHQRLLSDQEFVFGDLRSGGDLGVAYRLSGN